MAEEIIGIKIVVNGQEKVLTSMAEIKKELKDATFDVLKFTEKFGATSKEAVEAAKRVAVLKDAIGDARTMTDAFNPDAKFKALASSLAGVAGGFSAVQGIMAVFGKENKNVEQALLKVNAAMALSQGLNALGDSIDSFKTLGAQIKLSTAYQEANNAATKTATVVQRAFGIATVETSTGFKVLKGAIVATGIGALVVALGAVINNFDKISEWIAKSPLGSFAKSIGNLVEQFTDFVGITSQAERNLTKLSAANKRANEDIENQIKILKAQGASEKEIHDLKIKQADNELATLRESLKTKGKLTEEEQKQFRTLQTDKLVANAEYNKKIAEDNKKANEKAQEEKKKHDEEIKKKNDEINKKIEEDTKTANKILIDLQNEKNKALIKDENDKAIKQLEIDRTAKEKEIEQLKVSQETKDKLIKLNNEKFEIEKAALEEKAKEDRDKKYKEEQDSLNTFNEKVAEIKANAIKDDNERAEAQRLAKLAKDLSDLDTDKEFLKKSEAEKAEIKKAVIDASELEGQKSKNEIVKKGLEDEVALLQAQQKGLTEDSDAYWKNLNDIEDKSYQAKLIAAKGNAKEIEKIEKEHANNKEEIAKQEKEAQLKIIKQRINDIQTFGSNLQIIAGKNKKLAIAGLLIEKAAAVTDVVVNTAKATTKAVAASPLTLGLPWSALIVANGVLQSAAIIKSAVDGVKAINSAGNSAGISENAEIPSGGSAPSLSSPSGGGGAVPDLGGEAAPDLGGGGGGVGAGGGGQTPTVRAYVVERDISDAQSRDAEIQNRARFQ
jgi:myosin heavy subunit